MKICIDAFGANGMKGNFLYSYTHEFMEHLFEMYPQPEYYIMNQGSVENKLVNNSNINLYGNSDSGNREYTQLDEYIKQNRINIYHSPNNGFSIPVNKTCKNIMTVYDLLPEINPGYVDKKYFEKFMRVFPTAVKNSDKIIVVSKFVKDQMKRYYNVPEEKLEVIYPGCSNKFQYKGRERCKVFLNNKYHIQDDYILNVGSIHPKNNLHEVLRLFKNVKTFKYAQDLKLVIAGKYDGKREEYYSKLKTLTNHLHIEDSVLFIGEIENDDMQYLYNGAKCVINLSQYDGFPLSALEALACQTPVLCSNTEFFREVLADSGIVINVEEEIYARDVVLEVLYNKKMSEKAIEFGKKQNEFFSWDKSIKNMVRVYENVIS